MNDSCNFARWLILFSLNASLLRRQALMKSTWRKHVIICLFLGLLAFPLYFLDLTFTGEGGGGNWITLDFRGLIFWTYITLLAIHVVVSSIAVCVISQGGGVAYSPWLDGAFFDSARRGIHRLRKTVALSDYIQSTTNFDGEPKAPLRSRRLHVMNSRQPACESRRRRITP